MAQEENSNTPHSLVSAMEISNNAAVRNWYDQHQAVHQHANHSYFSQMPSQYSNGKKLLNVFMTIFITYFVMLFCLQ